ncbi:MAG: N-acetyltransferase, partial [Planctomycetia bacterium]|nr:N-acetyltransferase [Planctomycetia bacterium]
MAELTVRPVETRAEQKRFVNLPWRIYRDDPCWMPPLVMSQEELLGFRPHPFYERSKSRSFLAT